MDRSLFSQAPEAAERAARRPADSPKQALSSFVNDVNHSGRRETVWLTSDRDRRGAPGLSPSQNRPSLNRCRASKWRLATRWPRPRMNFLGLLSGMLSYGSDSAVANPF